MYIFGGLFRLKSKDKMEHNVICIFYKIGTFFGHENYNISDKKGLNLEKQSVKSKSHILNPINLIRRENFVFQKKKKQQKFLDISKRLRYQDNCRWGYIKCQRPFCICKCILIFGWHSKSSKVIATKCDHRKLLLQIIEGRRKHAFVFIIFLF